MSLQNPSSAETKSRFSTSCQATGLRSVSRKASPFPAPFGIKSLFLTQQEKIFLRPSFCIIINIRKSAIFSGLQIPRIRACKLSVSFLICSVGEKYSLPGGRLYFSACRLKGSCIFISQESTVYSSLPLQNSHILFFVLCNHHPAQTKASFCANIFTSRTSLHMGIYHQPAMTLSLDSYSVCLMAA